MGTGVVLVDIAIPLILPLKQEIIKFYQLAITGFLVLLVVFSSVNVCVFGASLIIYKHCQLISLGADVRSNGVLLPRRNSLWQAQKARLGAVCV